MLPLLIFLLLFSSCERRMQEKLLSCEPSYSLTIFVDPPQLDYRNGQKLVNCLVRRSYFGFRPAHVGHVWIRLKGENEVIEGGHSGEFGLREAKYVDGIGELFESGEMNPVRYLHRNLSDGVFQEGSGGHVARYQKTFPLSQEQYLRLRQFIDEEYHFSRYSILNHQCVTLASNLLSLIGIDLEHRVLVPLPRELRIGSSKILLWTDEEYSQIELASPDIFCDNLKSLDQNRLDDYNLLVF